MAFLLIFLFGPAGIILSAIGERTRNKTLMLISIGPVAISLILLAVYNEMFFAMLSNGNILGFVYASFIVVPGIFGVLYLQKADRKTGAQVTNDYLDEIINSEDDFTEEEYE